MKSLKTDGSKIKTMIPRTVVFLLVLLFVACGSIPLVPKNVSKGKAETSEGKSTEEFAQDFAVSIALEATQVPVQDVMVWITDDKGNPSTLWLRGNKVESILVAARSDIVIPWEGHLFVWEENLEQIPLCDCEYVQSEIDTKACNETGGSAELVSIYLKDLISEAEMELPIPEPQAHTGGKVLSQFKNSVSLVASVGRYLFVKHQAHETTCPKNETNLYKGFFVFDLDSGSQVDLLSQKESEQIENTEQMQAFSMLSDGSPGGVSYASDLDLQAIEPQFGPGFLMQLFFRFGISTTDHVDTGSISTTYDESVRIPATLVPEALVPFIVPPAALVVATQNVKTVHRGGFNMIAGTEEQLAKMLGAFVQN